MSCARPKFLQLLEITENLTAVEAASEEKFKFFPAPADKSNTRCFLNRRAILFIRGRRAASINKGGQL